MREWFLQHVVLTYVCLAMALSYVVQFFVNRKRLMKLTEKFANSFICALLTASISVPLLDLYPELPPSVVLLVGSFCGAIGFEGVTGIMHTIERTVSGRISGYMPPEDYEGVTPPSVPPQRKTHYYRPRGESSEPPLPDDLRE